MQTLQVANFRKKFVLSPFWKILNRNKIYLLMLLPGSLLLLVFNYLPMLGVMMSFKRMRFYSSNIFVNFIQSKWIGFKNFEFFLNTPDAWRITRNTVGYNLAFIFLGLIFSVAFAIGLNEVVNKRLAKFYQTAMMLPYFLSWVVVSYVVYAFLNENYGLMNRIVLPFFKAQGIMWYTAQNYWPFILILLSLWKNVGYNAVVYIAAISGIDQEFYEAASIDGASKWQQMKNITLPHLVPLMTILTILAIGRIFRGDFGLFYFSTMELGRGNLKPVADVLDTYVYDALNTTGNIGMSTAAGLYQSVVGFVLVLISNYLVTKVNSENSMF